MLSTAILKVVPLVVVVAYSVCPQFDVGTERRRICGLIERKARGRERILEEYKRAEDRPSKSLEGPSRSDPNLFPFVFSFRLLFVEQQLQLCWNCWNCSEEREETEKSTAKDSR